MKDDKKTNENIEDLRCCFKSFKITIQGLVLNNVFKRITLDPHPTEEELRLGTFIEFIEPQVQNAVRILNTKGYSTNSSGFAGEQAQYIDGLFKIDTETQEKLIKMTVSIKEGFYTSISFIPDEPDLETIKQKWEEIANIFPDLGFVAEPADNLAANNFRKFYSKQ